MKIRQYVNKFTFNRILFLVLRYVISCVNTVIGCFILSVLVDKIFPLPIIVFHIYWFVIIAFLLLFFANLVLRIYQTLRFSCLQLQKFLIIKNLLKSTDDLINAYQLEDALISPKDLNYSEELARDFVENVKTILSKVDIIELSGLKNIIKVIPLNLALFVITYILYAIPPYVIRSSIHKILFTRRPEILGIFISPKNLTVRSGEVCEIKVIVEKEYSLYVPELLLKTYGDKKFYKVNFEKTVDFAGRKVYVYLIPSVETTILYKVKFRGMASKVYKIEPLVLPNIVSLDIKVTPPQYTGQPVININNFSELQYLYGSKVSFSAKTNKAIQSAFLYLYGEKIKLDIGTDLKTVYGSFIVRQGTELWFEFVDTDGLMNSEAVKYRIHMIEDRGPKIQIISPENDIIVEPNSMIPIVYSVTDDFGIHKIEIVYEIEKKVNKTVKEVKKYQKVATEDIDEYLFDLSKLKLDFGDIIKYRMIVYDNDILYGYKSDFTDERKIEIFSYEKKHQLIEEQIKKFIDKSIELLSQEVELYESISKLTTDYMPDINTLVFQSQNMNIQYDILESMIKNILSEMTSDPYTTVDTMMEFRNLNYSIETLRSKLNPKRIDSLKQRDISSALQIQDQIINTLERATMLSKDIIKRQNMENISRLMEDNLGTNRNLLDALRECYDKISEEDRTKIFNLLSQIEERLKKIQESLTKFKDELPDEFVNRREIKNLDFITPMDILTNIYGLINRNDIKSAIKLAEQLLEQLELLTQNINKVAKEQVSASMLDLTSNLEKVVSQLDNIIVEQQNVYQGTKEIDEFRISEISKYQEKQFPILEKKSEEISKNIDNIILYLDNINNFTGKDVFRQNATFASSKLKDFQQELKNERLIQGSKYFEDIKSIWEQNVKISSASQQYNPVLFSSTVVINQLINEVVEILKTEPKIIYPSRMKEKQSKLCNKQSNIGMQMDEFIKEIKNLGSKSFIVNSDDVNLAISARAEMTGSFDCLNSLLIPKAIQHQNTALNLLLQLRNNFSDKQQQLQQLSQQAGKSVAGTTQLKHIPGGKIGVLIGNITLPSAKDYRPPKEIREEIIKSLSEKYPDELKHIIDKYYKEVLK
ncbi:MAG: hypothetical protein NZ928_03165 [Endomicrobia bacterium]|nr:hypothetical protein [Endomicrobiia bacterium]